ncbi:DNA primase TraC [Marinovum algicola]|uniref:Antirestriction protein ArdC n=1 Tax=Marinovum algicola TaxID=42444 RepID=A0A975WDT5_9RHOB|nr:zincin-like metallopeptidase domain-containing protein [Marinovum algicola]SEK03778.1 Antirestriction protein ArdC [Marinovum algicola]SLN74646.1 DNA primase TraC [Marinovum algicola]
MAKSDFDIYQHVTNQIIEAMEAGVSPWRKPWSGGERGGTFPLRANGEPYRGINVLMLWLAAHANGFASAHWFTFKQAKDLGAHVRKGQKSSTVVKYGTVERENDDGEAVAIPYARAYRVFNADQIEGLPEEFYNRPEVQEDLGTRPLPEVDVFFQAVGANVTHGGARACYIPSEDRIQMPPVSAFISAQHYTATLCHEVTHWTGHRSRLDRFKVGSTKADYAREELIAEIGSCFLGAHIGVEPTINEAASYLDSWLGVLKEDKRAIFKAASAAQKAADFVLEAAAAGGALRAA